MINVMATRKTIGVYLGLGLVLPAVGAFLLNLSWGLWGSPPVPAEACGERRLSEQTDADVLAKSHGCLTCHQGIEPMHASPLVKLGCTDCHGGCADALTKEDAHVPARFPDRWPTSANPERTFALLNKESPEFVQFINPGDWRSAHKTCGTVGCHEKELSLNHKSIMGHSAMVPGSALYNNGSAPNKIYRWGEVYTEGGVANRVWSNPRATPEDIKYRGVVPFIDPLPRWEITQPGNVFRVLEINNNATSLRGPGTDFRIDAVFLNLVKTKLNDPTMVFLGTNDHPGDYRTSGCTSCHVPYANDRDPKHSGHLAQYGNKGHYHGNDPCIPKNESGHPIKHQLTRSIPSSQCVSCHFHQGSGASANYYGYQWWDYESQALEVYSLVGNPGMSGHVGGDKYTGVWGGPKNPNMPDLAQEVPNFADFHNGGWPLQAVYKTDRKGRWLDGKDQVVDFNDPKWHDKVVHLADVHMERGMHCIDCHFYQDSHGNGQIHSAMIDEVEINCKDCHGNVSEYANLTTSNAVGGNNLRNSRTAFGERRFVERDGKIFQRSSMVKGQEWEVTQVKDVITPGHAKYNEKARYAKTIQRDGKTWGHVPEDQGCLAHTETSMSCYACHSSWNNTCSGCHLDAYTNLKTPNLHYEGEESKFYSAYNPEANRTDGFYLGKNGTVQGNKTSPVRSASGVIVSARDGNRAMVLHQQPTISAEGFSGHAMTPNPPHTVRGKETKKCTDCHVSAANDNNAVTAQVYGLGVHGTDMIGRYVWTANCNKGLEAVRVTCGDDFPQPVIGSDFQGILDPESYNQHVCDGGYLKEAFRHESCDARCVQRYGEWVMIADGAGGFRIFDAANIANKNEAQRLIESPLSPVGQSLRVPSRNATWVGLPSVLPMDSCRTQRPENEEQPVNPLFNHAFITDTVEGLIVVNIHTLVDGNPSNNFLARAATFNPEGLLDGAVRVQIAGRYAYVLAEVGLVVIDVDKPCAPKVVAVLGHPDINCPKAIDIQFRYAFICDADGLKVVDITYPLSPVVVTKMPLADARDIRLMRSYAYIAAGKDGLAIVDVEKPTMPGQPYFFNAGGCMNDTTAVQVGATYASLYAYVGDGRNGLRVIQLVSPKDSADAKGFSPTPKPLLIATHRSKAPVVAVSEGLPRDRYVDESGNQIGVFGRRGSRPFNLEELQRMYLRNGELWTVTDQPSGPPTAKPAK
jgi:hypothetical protein